MPSASGHSWSNTITRWTTWNTGEPIELQAAVVNSTLAWPAATDGRARYWAMRHRWRQSHAVSKDNLQAAAAAAAAGDPGEMGRHLAPYHPRPYPGRGKLLPRGSYEVSDLANAYFQSAAFLRQNALHTGHISDSRL